MPERATIGAIFPDRDTAEQVRGSLRLRGIPDYRIYVDVLQPSAGAVLGQLFGLSTEEAARYEPLARAGGIFVGARVGQHLVAGLATLFQQRGGTVVEPERVTTRGEGD